MGASAGINVGVDGVSEYVRDLNTVTSETKAFQSELKALQSSFDKNASTWSKTTATAGVLSDEIRSQYEKIALLKDEQSKFATGSKEWYDYATKINKATDALNKMETQLKELPNRIQAIGQDFENWGEKIEKGGEKISKVGDALTKKVSLPIVGAMTAAVKTTADYESAMDRAWSVTGALDSSLSDIEKQDVFNALSAEARKMGEATKFTASEAADAIYYMGLAGWDADSVLSGLSGVMNLAAASGEDLARTSDIVTDSLTAFGQTADQSDHFADVLAATMANSNTTVDLLGDSFKYVGAVAGSFGYSIDDVALGLGLMANAGVKGSQAGTALRQAIQKLTDPTDKTAAVMEKYGISLFDTEGKALSFGDVIQSLRGKFGGVNVDIQEMASVLENDGEEALDNYVGSLELTMTDQEKLTSIVQMFGTRALPAVLAMIDASEEDYNKLSEAIRTSSDEMEVNGEKFQGAAEAMAAVQLDNFTGQVTILKSKLQELAISFGEQMMPTLMNLVDGAQKFVDGLNSMDDGTKEMIIKVGLFVAAVGPVLSVGGRLISGVGTLVSGVGGLLKFVGGLAGTGASVAGGIGTVVSAIGGGASGLIGGIGSVVGAIGSVVTAAAPFLIGGLVIAGIVAGVAFVAYEIYKHWDGIKEATGKLKDWVSDKWDGINESCSKAWDGIKEATSHGWEAAKKTWNDSMSEIHTAYEKHGGGVVGLAAAAMEGIHQAHDFGFNLLNNLTNGKLEGLRSLWDSTLGSLVIKAGAWGVDLVHNFSQGIGNGIGFLKDTVSGIAQRVKNFLGFSEPSEGPLSDFHTYAPDMMKLYAEGIGDNTDVVTGKLQSLGLSMNSIFGEIKGDGYSGGTGTAENMGIGFENQMHRITNAAENMKMSVRSSLMSLASMAHDWGADLAGNMANGIQSAMSRAVNAASSLAGKLSSYLHFSEPDVGPLSDFHTYMPDMMKQIAGGIYQNMGLVEGAADALASVLVPNVETGAIAGRGNSTTMTYGDMNINIYGAEGQDVRELARIVEQEITFNMNRRSAAYA